MGGAILAGLIGRRVVSRSRVRVCDQVRGRAKAFAARFGVRAARDNRELVLKSEIVILAVKPQDLKQAASEIALGLGGGRSKILITILAGTTVQKIRRLLGPKLRLVRAMPNLGAQVGEGMTAVTSSDRQALALAERIFSSCGRIVKIDEKYFDVVTAVSGSGPAYFFLMMELLAKAAHRAGLSRQAAQLLAVQTAAGAGRLAQASKDGPDILRQKVTSKKGTTEAALKFFRRKGFENILIGGVQKAIQRSRELSKK